MKKWLIMLLTSVILSGCATLQSGAPSDLQVLLEGAAIALLAYETSDSDDPEIKGADAIKSANEYLLFSFGRNAIGKPKYTVAGLIHDQILYEIVDSRTRRLMFIARTVLKRDGSLTGMTWADALILGETVDPD